MTKSWFIGRAEYLIVDENGKTKKQKEDYLVDGVCCADTEKRILEHVSDFVRDEIIVSSTKEAKVWEVIPSENSDANTWYKVKITLITINEKSGKEKRSSSVIFIQDVKIGNVCSSLEKFFANSVTDYEVECISKTNIQEVLETSENN